MTLSSALATTLAHSGEIMELPYQVVRASGVFPEKKIEFLLLVTREPGTDVRISRFECDLNHKRAAVPVAALRQFPNPDLNHIRVEYVIPGFTGVIASSIDPSTDRREHILLTIPHGESVVCTDEESSSSVDF